MSLTLKDCVNPWKAADKCIQVSGRLPVAEMSRLAEALLEKSGEIAVDLEFERNQEKLPFLKGSINGSLVLECQRCLDAMELPLQSAFSLAFKHAGRVLDSEDSQSSEHYDFYEVEDEQICLTDVIEDEILLLLPQVPMHMEPSCVIKTEFGDEVAETTVEEKQNPFAVLASLKDKFDS